MQSSDDTNLYVLVDQGDEIAHPDLHTVIRNSHSIWFAVQTLDNHTKSVLLPPCGLKGQWSLTEPLDYDCTDSVVSLGRITLLTNNRAAVSIDGTGGDSDAAQHLLFVYGAEVFWRAAMGEPLPPSMAQRLEDAAWGLSDAEIQNFGGDLGAAGPVYDFVKIGSDLKDANIPGAMGDVFDLGQNQAVTDWLVSRGLVDAEKMNAWAAASQAAGRGVYVVELATELGDLPLRFSIEALASGGATSGILEFHVPDYVANAAAAEFSNPTPIATQPTPITNKTLAVAFNTLDGALWIARGADPRTAKRVLPGPVSSPAWSHEGTRLALLKPLGPQPPGAGNGGEQIVVMQPDGSGARVVFGPVTNPRTLQFPWWEPKYETLTRVRWTPDDSALLYQWYDGSIGGKHIARVDLRTGEQRDMGVYASDFDVLPDGRLLVSGYENGPDTAGTFLDVVDPDGHQQELVAPSDECCTYAASPDGRIAYTEGASLVLVQPDGTSSTQSLPSPKQYVMGWTGDGWLLLGDPSGVSLFSPISRQAKNFIGGQVRSVAVVQ